MCVCMHLSQAIKVYTLPKVCTLAPTSSNRSTTAVGITGTFSAGQVLTANAGNWAPAGATLTYQWMRGRALISGATSSTYTVQAGDVNQDLLCIVTATSQSQGPAVITLRARR